MSINDIAKVLISNMVFNKVYDLTESKECAGSASSYVENSFLNDNGPKLMNKRLKNRRLNRRLNR